VNIKREQSKVGGWRQFKKVHPAAEVFPLMGPDELRKLADDIQAHGIRIPIQTRTAEDGQLYVIDGRNRLDACEVLGWQLVDEKGEWRGKITSHIEYKRKNHNEIIAEVVSLNLQRRHLTTSQRAMYAAELANMKIGRPGKAANWPVKTVSQSEAGTLASVSERSVRRAKQLLDEAPAKIVEAVKSGKLAVSKALEAIKPKPDKTQQRAERIAELKERQVNLVEQVHAMFYWGTLSQHQRERFINRLNSGVDVWKGTEQQ
jgi:ParB-like chromosome segregation protein Spo0J